MREIKFRVWDEILKQMFCWEEVNEGQQILTDAFNGIDAVAMQYTGLKDKNGVEIYEGDIVRAASINIEVKANPSVSVSHGHGNCSFTASVTYFSCYGTGDDVVVEGNRFENPELLEGED